MYAPLEQLAHLVVAQGQPAAAPTPGSCNDPSSLLLMVAFFAIFYFILIRPQQKERKKHEELIKSLKRGDEVMTQAGLIGKVADLNEKVITLEVARNVKIKVVRSTVARKIDLAALEGGKDDEDKAKS